MVISLDPHAKNNQAYGKVEVGTHRQCIESIGASSNFDFVSYNPKNPETVAGTGN